MSTQKRSPQLLTSDCFSCTVLFGTSSRLSDSWPLSHPLPLAEPIHRLPAQQHLPAEVGQTLGLCPETIVKSRLGRKSHLEGSTTLLICRLCLMQLPPLLLCPFPVTLRPKHLLLYQHLNGTLPFSESCRKERCPESSQPGEIYSTMCGPPVPLRTVGQDLAQALNLTQPSPCP